MAFGAQQHIYKEQKAGDSTVALQVLFLFSFFNIRDLLNDRVREKTAVLGMGGMILQDGYNNSQSYSFTTHRLQTFCCQYFMPIKGPNISASNL